MVLLVNILKIEPERINIDFRANLESRDIDYDTVQY